MTTLGGAPTEQLIADVRSGLTSARKSLPPYLLYDARGCELYEQITRLPEYYLTRAERAIFDRHAGDIADAVDEQDRSPLAVVELGAGTATKTEVLLRELLDHQDHCTYVPIDVSSEALDAARARLERRLPELDVHAIATTHEHAFPALERLPGRKLALFIGSSIGNLPDAQAAVLLERLHRALGPDSWLLLGTDLRKSPEELLAAYDDASGVTAAFNLNLLSRLNRELGAAIDVEKFRHRAFWNEECSCVEMHLESLVDQDVLVSALGLSVHFRRGETIHTESSIKYDLPRVDALLAAAGFRTAARYFDEQGRYAVHLAGSVRSDHLT